SRCDTSGAYDCGQEVGVVRRTYKVNWLLSLGQRDAGVGGVATELLDQGVDARKARRIAQTTDHLDGYPFAVPIAARVEQVHLEAELVVAERRSRSEIHHSAK